MKSKIVITVLVIFAISLSVFSYGFLKSETIFGASEQVKEKTEVIRENETGFLPEIELVKKSIEIVKRFFPAY